MKLDDLVLFVEKFILDVIGVVLPGVTLLLGLGITVDLSSLDQQWLWMRLSATGKWVVFICISYISGYALHSLGEKVLVPLLGSLSKGAIRSSRHVVEQAEKSLAFSAFIEIFSAKYHLPLSAKESKIDFHTARNLAMTLAPDVDPLTYKFMFISLMNLGVATAISLNGITFAVARYGMVSTSLRSALAYFAIVLLGLFGLPCLFLLKYTEFCRRAMTVPFPVATLKLLSSSEESGRGTTK